jgi:carboxypeptidase T
MGKSLSSLFRLGLTVTASLGLVGLLGAEELVVARIYTADADAMEHFRNRDYEIATFQPGVSVDIITTDTESKALAAQGFRVDIRETESQMKANLARPAALGKGNAPPLKGYRSYAVMLAELKKLEADHPEICKLFDIGDSRGKQYYAAGKQNYAGSNHDIWALKVSRNVAVEEDEPNIYYSGEHHAREPISLEVCFAVLNNIVKNYGKDSAITKAVDSKQIWFVPLVNPDGHKIVTDSVNTLWRKNIRDNNNNSILETASTGPDGVDINRNYGFNWGGLGTSNVGSDETFRGLAEWSEPETMAIKNLLDAHHFTAGISYHSYNQFVLHAYGYNSGTKAPDHQAMGELGVKMAATIPKIGTAGFYEPKPWHMMYPAAGILDDYAYGNNGIFMYTIELGVIFVPPPADIPKITQDNLKASLILLNRINQSTLLGHAYAQAGSIRTPITGKIHIKEIDDSVATRTNFRAPYKTDKAFGAYYRMLPAGTYSGSFTPDSSVQYPPKTFSGIKIDSTGNRILDFVYESVTGTANGSAVEAWFTRSDLSGPGRGIGFPSAAQVSGIDIYSMGGKLIRRYARPGSQDGRPRSDHGARSVVFPIAGLPEGMYLIKAQGAREQRWARMVLAD